jgi:hypothetical protein
MNKMHGIKIKIKHKNKKKLLPGVLYMAAKQVTFQGKKLSFQICIILLITS